MPSIRSTSAWKALENHRAATQDLHMRDLFADDPGRFDKFTVRTGDMLLDYSKNRITSETMSLLRDLAREADVEKWREKMFSGEKINNTEGRAVLHVALRNSADRPILVDGKDVMPDVARVLDQMRTFSDAVRSGAWKG